MEREKTVKLLSINVGIPREVEDKGRLVTTSIFKDPVDGPVMVRELNIDGDRQSDLRTHGGPYKAVYAYPYEHYTTWQHELGRDDFVYGQFGENLTVTGLLETDVYVGNIYRIGGAVLQITQPRVPCFKLNIRMGDPMFSKFFMQSERTGFYVRVIEEGEISPGDAITLVEKDPQQMTVRDINHLLYFEPDPYLAERALQIEALSPGWRGSFEEMLV